MNSNFLKFKKMINENNSIKAFFQDKNLGLNFFTKINDKDDFAFGTIEGFWGVAFEDICEYDLSWIDKNILASLPFSTFTNFPGKENLPNNFDKDLILQQSGLDKRIEKIHKQGITGKGTTIAVIDFPMEFSHIELKNQSIRYINRAENSKLEHHGYGIVSRIIGKNIGIAPDCNLLYYPLNIKPNITVDERILEIAKDTLNCYEEILEFVKNGGKVDIISCSGSILNNGKDFAQRVCQIKSELAKYNVEVFDIDDFYLKYNCDYVHKNTPDMKEDCIDNYYTSKSNLKNSLTMIDGGKKIILPFSENDYLYKSRGCASYTLPQFVAAFALARQQNSNIKFDTFMQNARESATQNKNGISFVNLEKTLNNLKTIEKER